MTFPLNRLDEMHFKQIVDKASYLIKFVDTKGNIIYVNKTWKEKMGYTEQDLETLSLWDIIHPDSHNYCHDIFTRVNSGESVEKIETLLLTKNSGPIPVQGNVNCMFDQHGSIIGSWGIFHDVTEQKKSLQALKESEKYNRSILEVIPDIIIRADENGRYLDIITSNEENLVQPREFLLGRTAEELLPADASGIIMQGIRNSLKTSTLQVVEYELMVPAGLLIFEARIVPSGNIGAKGQEVLLLIRDITDSKEREEELLQNQKRATKQRTAIVELIHDEVFIAGKLIEVFKRITEIAANTIEVARASIWILNDRETELKCLSLYETDSRKHSSDQILNAQSIPSYFEAILLENRIYSEDAQNDPRTSELSEKYLKPLGITSMLDAGIVIEGKIKGVICLEHIGPPRKWHIDEESFVSLVASLAGQAMINFERRDINRSLQFQLDYERVVADISSYFVNQGWEELDEAINYALKRISLLFKVDRSYIFQLSTDGKYISNTHEWCAENITCKKEKNQDIPLEYLPWFSSQIKSKDYVYIENLTSLPPEAEAERDLFQWQDITSLLCVPLYRRGMVTGFFGFDIIGRTKTWEYEHIILLKVIAELISSALTKHQSDQTIRFLSFHDRLTGLYNRHFLEEEMSRLDTERQLPISMIMADLNGLKLINDTYGHTMGDELLKKVAEILNRSCRSEDIIARWGGDEFIVLLPQTPGEEADRICRRIAINSRSTYVNDIPVSIALGVGNKLEAEIQLVEVLRRAENDMYKQKLTESRSTKNAVLQALLKTLAEKSFETEEHTRRMQEVAQKIGKKMSLPENELRRLDLLITLHDIGKINIAEEILSKKGSLSEEEWRQIKRHPEIGYKIARATEDFSHVAEEILCHHERWDGTGYPRGLEKDKIPLLARITAVADAFEVMSNGRPYKKVMNHDEIVNEFEQCAGSHFDPEIVEIFLPLITQN